MLKVYNKEVKKDVYLDLKERAGSILLIAVDENGAEIKKGVVLEIMPNRRLFRHPRINQCLGFDLDIYGRIRD